MRRRARTWILVSLAAIVLVLGAIVIARRSSARPEVIDARFIVEVKRAPLAIEIIETGKIQPREKVELKSKVAGQVQEVFVEEGETVKKGQLLLKLDPIDYKREVARADAELAQARNALEFAKAVLEHRRVGFESKITSEMEHESAVNDVKVRSVAVRTAEIALGASQDRLRYTQISSPLDGTVTQRGIQPGEVVVPGVQATFEGKALLTVADLSTLLVKVDLNQIDVAKVRLGKRATLVLDALPGRTFEATITKISPASIRPTGKDVEVFPVEAKLTQADPEIKPGMTADVRFHLEGKASALALPIEAVVKENGKSFVTRVVPFKNGWKSEKIEVTLGARNDREVEIASGVGEHDKVVVKPASASENELKM